MRKLNTLLISCLCLAALLLQACSNRPKDDLSLVQAVVDSLAAGKTYRSLSSVASEDLHDAINQDCLEFMRESGTGEKGSYWESYEGALERQASFTRLMGHSFEALGLLGKAITVASIVSITTDTLKGCHHAVEAHFEAPYQEYLLQAGIYSRSEGPVVSWVMWNPDSWEAHIDAKYKAYFKDK